MAQTMESRKPQTMIYPQTRYRQIQHLQPGQWWVGQYEKQNGGRTEPVWARVASVSHVVQRSGWLVIDVRGVTTDGLTVQMMEFNGAEVPSLTERQAAKLGLRLPA